MRWPISNTWDTPAKHSGQEKTQEKSSLFRSVLEIVPPSTGRWVCLGGVGCNGEEGCCTVDAVFQGLAVLGHRSHRLRVM